MLMEVDQLVELFTNVFKQHLTHIQQYKKNNNFLNFTLYSFLCNPWYTEVISIVCSVFCYKV